MQENQKKQQEFEEMNQRLKDKLFFVTAVHIKVNQNQSNLDLNTLYERAKRENIPFGKLYICALQPLTFKMLGRPGSTNFAMPTRSWRTKRTMSTSFSHCIKLSFLIVTPILYDRSQVLRKRPFSHFVPLPYL